MRQTSRRVARILRIDGATRGSKFAVSLATVFAVSSFGALLQAPELVSFVGTQTAPAVALASNRQFRRHLAGNVTAINASFATRRDAAAPRAVATATKSAPEMHAIVRSVPTEVTHVQPAVHVVRASMTADSPRVVTYVLVLRDENSITVWRISTWQYAPSRQVRPIGKTT
jgi:hypothetical protein